jgi:hypothetical protein
MFQFEDCARCGRPATKARRLPTSVGTLGLPQPVCRVHAAEADELAEHLAKAAIDVDHAVKGYRGGGLRLAA